MPPPLITVVIPTFNHRDYISATLASVFSQTLADYEVIVINDGSPDDTAEIVRPLAEVGRIRYLEHANRGEAAARNLGLAEARGRYVAFLDDDDLWPPDKLAWQARALADVPDAVLVYGTCMLFEGSQDPEAEARGERAASLQQMPSGRVHTAFLRRNWIRSLGQTLIRRSTLAEVGGFDESIRLANDYDLYIRLASHGPFVLQKRCALFHRLHQDNASKEYWTHYTNVVAVRRKHLGRMPRWPHVRCWLANYNYFRCAFHSSIATEACRAYASGDTKLARTLWVQACRVNPLALGQMSVLKSLVATTLPGLYHQYRRFVSTRAGPT
jgi:glycosyltransferase involved in cell wall biosynthesis